MTDSADIRFLLTIRESGSLAAAARKLDVSPSAVTPPDELAKLPCLVLRENGEDMSLWQFRKGRTTRSVRVAGHLICNDGDVIRHWASEGRGIMLRSEWDVADAIARGQLVRLLSGWKAPDADVIALTHHRAGLPARTRHFLRYLQGRFRPLPPWRA